MGRFSIRSYSATQGEWLRPEWLSGWFIFFRNRVPNPFWFPGISVRILNQVKVCFCTRHSMQERMVRTLEQALRNVSCLSDVGGTWKGGFSFHLPLPRKGGKNIYIYINKSLSLIPFNDDHGSFTCVANQVHTHTHTHAHAHIHTTHTHIPA